ncbi:winged helix DNA-binding domain-containing protein [Streptomyces sp. NPDC086023]|uniref:winged helix DNA-binding domain-containing protein n=1 Tax=Streptomyces sp. NPDC086023 TaxID=3365746 RepID=UPI0037D45D55
MLVSVVSMDATKKHVLGPRALNRATLARQLLLRRSGMGAGEAVSHLLGLQAQNVKPPYFQLWSRLEGFEPAALAALMESREVLRMVTMRSTIHTHTAEDALVLRPLVQPARDREINNFRKGLVDVDLPRLAELSRRFVEAEPRTMAEIREELLKEWPHADPPALSVAARCLLPLVQVTPRGVWGRSGQVRLTTLDNWLGRTESGGGAAPDRAREDRDTDAVLDATVLRYLAAFGPASVQDMQTWAGLTRLREAFERLRPRLVTFRSDSGTELFDLPDAPRPDEDTPAPARFLPEFDNLLLSHADRTRVVPEEYRGRTWQGNQARCTFLVDGFLAGTWRLEQPKGGAAALLTVEPFGRLTRQQRAELTAEGHDLLAALTEAGEGDVRFGPVDE